MTVQIDIDHSYRKTKKEANNTLLWYNTSTKKMEKFQGGKLNFVYSAKEKRVKPQVEKLLENRTELISNQEAIKEWFKEHEKEFDLELREGDGSVFIEFAESEKDEIEDLLDREGFHFDFMENGEDNETK